MITLVVSLAMIILYAYAALFSLVSLLLAVASIKIDKTSVFATKVAFALIWSGLLWYAVLNVVPA